MSALNRQDGPPPELVDAVEILRQCERMSRPGHADYDGILKLLEPYRSCRGFPNIDANSSAGVLSLICATTADCYRELGDIALAASWYQRAGSHREGTGFSEYYAEMVVTHRMKDHYRTAMNSLHAGKSRWRQRPLFTRIYYNVVSMIKNWSAWRMSRKTNRLTRRLAKLIEDDESTRE